VALAAAANQPVSIPLVGEWNLLGNPLVAPMPWQLSAFTVIVDGQSVGTMADSNNWAYVDPYSWIYQAGAYQLVFDNTQPGFAGVQGAVPEQAGFWLRRTPSSHTVAIVLNVSQLTSAGGATPTRRAVSRDGWALTLTAHADGQANSAVTLGAGATLHRSLLLPHPPAMGPASPLSLSVVEGTSVLAGEIRAGVLPTGRFELTAAGPAGAEVTLSWPSLGRALPAGMGVTLIDEDTGRRFAMSARSTFAWQSSATPRHLAVEIGATGSGRAQLALSAVPTRGRGAELTLRLSAPATVEVQVRSLSGRLVKDLPSQAAAAGATVLSWDGTDQSGRPVPAGIYQLWATATADDGSLTRVAIPLLAP